MTHLRITTVSVKGRVAIKGRGSAESRYWAPKKGIGIQRDDEKDDQASGTVKQRQLTA